MLKGIRKLLFLSVLLIPLMIVGVVPGRIHAQTASHPKTGLKFFWYDGTNMHTYYDSSGLMPNQYMAPLVYASNNAMNIAAEGFIGRHPTNVKKIEFAFQLGITSIGAIEKTLPYTFYTSYSPRGLTLYKVMEFGMIFDRNEASGFYNSKGWRELGIGNYTSSSPLAVNVGNLTVVFLQKQKTLEAFDDQNGKLIYSAKAQSIQAASKLASKL